MRKRKVWQLVMIVTHIALAGAWGCLGCIDIVNHGDAVIAVLKFVLCALLAFLAGMYIGDATVVERRARNVK